MRCRPSVVIITIILLVGSIIRVDMTRSEKKTVYKVKSTKTNYGDLKAWEKLFEYHTEGVTLED